MMREGLSELIEHPMGVDGERRTQDSIYGEEATEKFESVITKLKREKKKDQTKMDQLSKELEELRKENKKLKEKCALLQTQVCLSLSLYCEHCCICAATGSIWN